MTSAEYAEDNPVITQLKELPVNVVSSPFNTFAIAVEDLEVYLSLCVCQYTNTNIPLFC